jgi:CobQ-like glutamine amidotransferase family enzyme
MSGPSLRLGHLYPGEMNIYADRGNIAVLERRLAWRGLSLEVTEIGIGDRIAPGAHDLFYLGGGQDRDQAVVADDLVTTKADALRAAVAGGAAGLCVCGGFQLAGHGYTGSDGSRMPGVGILDLDTVAGTTRLIGNLVIDAELDGERRTVVGFENHAGRTRLGPGSRPLGRVLHGHGNNGEDGLEGGVTGRVIGTYLHGPLLPKNPWLADTLISWGLEHRTGAPVALASLDDTMERAAHDAAIAKARRRRAR